jgi:hypothetical protein
MQLMLVQKHVFSKDFLVVVATFFAIGLQRADQLIVQLPGLIQLVGNFPQKTFYQG